MNSPHKPKGNPPIKAGDLLYAVGPGHPAPHSATDLLVYSTEVKAVRLGSEPGLELLDCEELGRARSAVGTTAQLTIELDYDRPHLGFPKWVYQSYELGINVHRSRTEALRAFAEQARCRRDHAELQRDHADKEVQWALTAAGECMEITP